MKKPEIPYNESQRMDALCGLNILDTPAEERFDWITRVAQRCFKVPITLVSLVDSERQWFKSRQGLDTSETARDISFCGHAILSEDILYIPNALDDPRFTDNPLVTDAPYIRFYAGAPLHAPEGQRIGTLCIIDDKPREFSSDELGILRDLADGVEAELERTHLLEMSHALRQSEERLQHLIDVSHGVTYACKAFGDYGATFISANAEEIMGYPPQAFTEDSGFWLAHVHPDEREQMLEDLEKLFEQGSYAHEYRFLHADGHYRWMYDKLYLNRDHNGAPQEIIGLWSDITEQKTTELQLLSSENRIRAIIDTVVDGIVTINARGLIKTFNPAAERLFGYSVDEVVGRNVKILMPESYAVEHDGYLHNYLTTGEKKVIGIGREVVGQRKDGSIFPMDLAVSEMAVNGERMFTGIVRDITERKMVEDTLHHAKEEAERNNRMKSEFLNMMSHELRTPLTVIIGYLPLLVDENNQPDATMIAEIARDMESAGNHLLHLINDLLDLSKIEAGKMTLQVEQFTISAMVQEILNSLKIKAEAKQTLLVNETLDKPIFADKVRLKQILINLVGNAIKFTEQGSITVTTRSIANGVEFSVADTGAGIPARDLTHIFDRFHQVDSSSTRNAGGTGLGLAITQKLVELHNGEISVTSVLGKGTTFTFTIKNQEIEPNG